MVDGGGKVVASATHEHQPFASPQTGWAEQDPQDWFHACAGAVRQVLHNGIDAQDIACVGLTGQMHGAVLLDDADEVLRPALIWCDQRSAPEAEALTRTSARRNWCSGPAIPR